MREKPFAHLPPTPATHFRLYFYAAVLHLIEQVVQAYGSFEATLERFPFLAGYNNELAQSGFNGLTTGEAVSLWRDALHAWEATVSIHLPLRALRESAALDDESLTLLASIGLVEEDARFGLLFEAMQGTVGQHRPTQGLLNAWSASNEHVRAQVRRLLDQGLVHVINSDAPHVEWAFEVPPLVWDALRGERNEELADWARYRPPEQLLALDELVASDSLRNSLAAIPAWLDAEQRQALIVRGPQHNGRRTVLGAIARATGRGSLEINGLSKSDDERWRLVGPLATLLHALPIIVLQAGPGETVNLPDLRAYCGPLGIVLGKQGGISGPMVDRALTLTLDIPDLQARRLHWQRALGPFARKQVDTLAERFRMSSGNIHRAAHLAQSYAALAGRTQITLADARQASHALNRQALDTLAVHVPAEGDWSQLVADAETRREIELLASRCRHRERLPRALGGAFGAQINAGVRALFSGPSGTGKTLAARLLAADLGMDLYRVDLSAVVSKYIGETEKNLDQVFSRAEELDVILLLDEGDALLTQRTSVQTSNDRYANLETNYLLQRLEAFEGILLITTNASQNVDDAFQRRIDVVVNFRAPDAVERLAIWQLHLPAQHRVRAALLDEVAQRCALTGGQIRNAALYGTLLALNDGGVVTGDYVETAVQREYRKLGAVCPLRRPPALPPVRE